MSVARGAVSRPHLSAPRPLAAARSLIRSAARRLLHRKGLSQVEMSVGGAAIDLSWAGLFHTVNISRWSEPPGADGCERSTWRVVVGAHGYHVSSNHPVLGEAIREVLARAASESKLGLPWSPSRAPGRR